ncbi:hypothetical protein CDD83_10872 [Cordyceps sp. RAO-2017]|nr:hypothetical protein CDD83_10872 [Cordyceps sp. RAO-2017]
MPRKGSPQQRQQAAAAASSATPGAGASPPAWLSDTSLALPELIVFDLDYTLWPFWVDTHVTPPLKANGPATAATDRLGERLAFYDDVPAILQALSSATGVRLGVASRTSAPDLARRLLAMLRLPAAQALDVFDAGTEIYPGSKMRHFEALQRRTGIPFERMLFFDDESRNRETEQLGVTMWLVRDGLTWHEMQRGIDEWRRRRGHVRAARDEEP